MEKYILGENIIFTTTERYEKEFKALGYKPYNKGNHIEENNEEVKSKRVRKSVKED